MKPLVIAAPMSGWCAALDEAPDAVFAQRMLGEGVAIDPTEGQLFAPCDAQVISVAPTCHAVSLRAPNGAELLLHVGIDTVALAGEGFRTHVKAGAQVRSGELLLEFDLELLAQRAKSLLTPIILTNAERFEISGMRADRLIQRGDMLFELRDRTVEGAVADRDEGDEVRESLTINHEHGIHARPAALIASAAKRAGIEITARAHGRAADARSALALMSLGVRRGDALELAARGPRAAAALRDLRGVIAQLASAPASAPVAAPPRRSAATANRLQGVAASRGLALGRAVRFQRPDLQVEEAGRGVALESAALERARATVRAALEELAHTASSTAREIMTAHLEFLDDMELTAAAQRTLVQGKSAGFAWRRAVRDSVEGLRSLGDAHLAQRIDDLLDVEYQVLRALGGAAPIAARELPERAILIAADLQPSQLVACDATRLAGVCLAAGGATSHVAILAAAMGVPALVALGDAVLEVVEGEWLVLDADHGVLTIAPDQQARAAAEQALAQRAELQRREREAAQRPGATADGVRIEVFANLGSVAEAPIAIAQGAEGCGLLRTEFLFLERDSPPDEDEQLRQYQAIADSLGDRPLVVRTLDVGGDKPLAYLPLPAEANPALGLRGVRTSLWRPDLLRAQLRAILRVRAATAPRVLLPMITDPAEISAVRRMLDEEAGERGPLLLGAMVETPASALLAARLAVEVDFFSIGTNDLTQYTLAMDRTHAELAARIDGLHPAVLRLIAATVAGAQLLQRPVAVCGGLASDPRAAAVLIGLGVRELSVAPTAIPSIKAVLRTYTLEACRTLALQALELDSAEAVRSLVSCHMPTQSQVLT